MAEQPDPFGHPGQAALYSAYRPTYPPRFLNDIMKTVSVSSGAESCYIDVCCGTGQVAIPLSTHFTSVTAVDRSTAQLTQARAECPDEIRFVQGDVLHLPVTDSHSIDLVTIGQGLHWLPLAMFFDEVKRVLRKSGVFAVLGYSICSVVSSPATQELFNEYFHKLDQHWRCDRGLIDSAFVDVEFPFEQVDRTECIESKTVALTAFHKYLLSMSAYRAWKAAVADSEEADILETFMQALRGNLGPDIDTVEVKTRFFLILMRPW